MKWIENENSENYLVGYSNEDQAYAVIKKKETINGTKLQLHIGSNKTIVPIPLCVEPEKISMEMVQGWFSLEQPKLLGRDAEGNEISVALVPNQIRWYINGYLFILINGCDKWSLNRNLDPLNLSLEEAISEISKNKKKSGFKILKQSEKLRIYRKFEKFFVCKDNQQYSIPENIDAELMKLSEAIEFVETIECQKRIKEEIIEQYYALPRMGYGEIIDILNSHVFDNSVFSENLSKIYEIMIENKVQFYSPGGSFKRKIWQSLMHIMGEKTNFKKDRLPKYIISEIFRDNILPIAELVASKRENKSLT